LEPESRQNIINMMHSRYCAPDSHPLLINYCREVITKMVNDILLPELAREVRAELIENAE
jgi:transcriptional accessory protein Tex/SPT6